MKKPVFLSSVLILLSLISCQPSVTFPEETQGATPPDESSISETYSASASETTDPKSEILPIPSETEMETGTLEETTADPVPEITTESPCRLLSFIVPKSQNRNMCEDLSGIITDNTVTIPITAPTDTFSLRNAAVETETDGASITFSSRDLTSPDCTCTITDENGLTRTYAIHLVHASHTIPVISIDTANGEAIVSKEEYASAVISIDTTGVEGSYLPKGFTSLEPTAVQIRGRGNSTWNWDKKPYKLKFSEKTNVLGMEKAKKWILLANYADYSLIRNYVAMETSKVLSKELSPLSQYPVNLFLNGEYLGIYTIGEDHEVKTSRIDLEKDNGTADTSFLLEIGGSNDEDIWGTTAFTAGLMRYCSIEYPEEDSLTAEQASFIINYCRKADEAVRSLDGYEEYLDVSSAIDWFLSTELFYNLESCFRRSCFMTKESGEPLRMGPIWDYDLAMGNLYNDFGQYQNWACLSQANGYIEDNWFCYLMKDPAFMAQLKARWEEKKDELLSTALSCIDEMSSLLSPSAQYNFERWNILGTRVVPPQPLSITSLPTYEDHIKTLRNFVSDRWTWMNSMLGTAETP